jgi:hypothetical protein
MPYFFDTKRIKLSQDKDRRFKVTDKDREEMESLYKQGITIREISRRFEGRCSRRTIQLTLFPERREHMKGINRLWREENGNSLARYGKEAWAKTIREHRRYKYRVLKDSL